MNTMYDESASGMAKVTSVVSSVGNLAMAWSQGLASGIAATLATGVAAVTSILEQNRRA